MFVCVCKSVTLQQLKEEINSQGPHLERIQRSCGAVTDCGACLMKLEKYLKQVSATAVVEPRSAAKDL